MRPALASRDAGGGPFSATPASPRQIVPAGRRKKGIASALVGTVEAAAKRLGYQRLYLFTSTAPALYAGLGWSALERLDYRGEHVLVMDKTL